MSSLPSKGRSIAYEGLHPPALQILLARAARALILSMMKRTPTQQTVVPIDWREEYEHWGLIPAGRETAGARRRFRALAERKGNCAFGRDVPKGMMDYIYRVTVRLGLRNEPLSFMKGTVRRGGAILTNAAAVRELDWGMGKAIIIPRPLRYGEHITLSIDGAPFKIRLMELIVLNALLHLARPKQSPGWHSAFSAAILAHGWKSLERNDMPRVESIDSGGK